jgi:hypothetical protein
MAPSLNCKPLTIHCSWTRKIWDYVRWNGPVTYSDIIHDVNTLFPEDNVQELLDAGCLIKTQAADGTEYYTATWKSILAVRIGIIMNLCGGCAILAWMLMSISWMTSIQPRIGKTYEYVEPMFSISEIFLALPICIVIAVVCFEIGRGLGGVT